MRSASRHPVTGLCVVVVGASLLASCTGGGGQLAQQSEPASSASSSAPSPPARPATSAAPATTAARAPNAPVPTGELRSPATAASTARELGKVEVALRGEDRDPRRLTRLGERQQLAYRALSRHPDWVAEVEGAVPEEVRSAVRANVDAGTALGALTGSGDSLPATFPDWQVLAPQDVATLRGYYDEAERATGVPWAYLAAIHFVESRTGRIHGPSSAGAQGPMQFIPETWASFGQGGDIQDDHDAIQAAARYLASRGAPADMSRALYSYNNDERYVTAIDAYARVMLEDGRAFDGYHAWRVFYATRDGAYLLPEGYGTP